MQFVSTRLQRLDTDAGRGRDLGEILLARRQEFMQRRVEQADGYRQARHHAENLGEIAALLGEQFCKRAAAPVPALAADPPAHPRPAPGDRPTTPPTPHPPPPPPP